MKFDEFIIKFLIRSTFNGYLMYFELQLMEEFCHNNNNNREIGKQASEIKFLIHFSVTT